MSVHNTYFTLPVLFVMISNHYAMTYGHPYKWVILVAISIAGAYIRTFFVARHWGKAYLLPVAAGVLLLPAVAVSIAPPMSSDQPAAKHQGVSEFARVQAIIGQRCVSCHGSVPTQAGFNAAPKGVMFDTREQILVQAAQIQLQTSTRVMPLGNLTGMTDDERTMIAAWLRHGASK